MSMQYTMTLSGMKIQKKPVALLGVFDPITEHPFAAVIGIAVGVVLGFAHGRKRRR